MIIVISLLALTLVTAGCAKVVEEESMPEASNAEVESMKEEEAMEPTESEDMEAEEEVADDLAEEAKMMNEGKVAPAFSLNDVNGNQVSLADFKGEKVYVKYWASWCSICLAGIEDMENLSNSDEFTVITIVTPDFKGEKSSEDFIKWFPSLETENMVVLLDEDGLFAKEFGVLAYPTSAYIGSDGVLVQVSPGHMNNEAIGEKMAAIQ